MADVDSKPKKDKKDKPEKSDKEKAEKKAKKEAKKEAEAAAASLGSPTSPNKAAPSNAAVLAVQRTDKAAPEDFELNRNAIEAVCREGLNNVCNDCGTQGTRWVSVNHGVFVCIRCSGIHRSIGTHVTKVKSTNLDKWTRAEIGVMLQLGNQRGKPLWEAKLPKGTKAPTPDSDDNVVRAFITQKYEDKAFAAPEWQEVLKRVYKSSNYKAGTKAMKSSTSGSAAAGKGGVSLFGEEMDKKKEKKKKKIFGAFGLVTVPNEEHDERRSKLLAFFGIATESAAANGGVEPQADSATSEAQ